MKILGLDYGRAKIGVATGDTETKFAEPLMVIRFKKFEDAMEKIKAVVKIENPTKIIMGISEGRMADETREFGKILQAKTEVPVKYQDETLSTYDAKTLSIEAHMKRSKRRLMEDAYSAAIMLQNYLEG